MADSVAMILLMLLFLILAAVVALLQAFVSDRALEQAAPLTDLRDSAKGNKYWEQLAPERRERPYWPIISKVGNDALIDFRGGQALGLTERY